MKPNEIITPDHVRWVLGIEEGLNCSIMIEKNAIRLYSENDGLDSLEMFEWIEGIAYDPDKGGVILDIHRFIYLAIEKCAAEGWKFIMDVDEFITIWHRINGGYERRQDFYLKDYPSWLHAQLAAIAWVYGKIQEGK